MKEDMRIRKTKRMIKEAFLNLLERNTLEQITIREITATAMCNRNTFYLHYKDKYDLMNKLCDHALDRLNRALLKANEKYKDSLEELYVEISRVCFNAMEEDINFYRLVLGEDRYPLFADLYRQQFVSYILTSIHIEKENETSKKIEIEFSTNGLLGVHRYWLLHQDEYSKEEILSISKNMVVGMGKMLYENKSH